MFHVEHPLVTAQVNGASVTQWDRLEMRKALNWQHLSVWPKEEQQPSVDEEPRSGFGEGGIRPHGADGNQLSGRRRSRSDLLESQVFYAGGRQPKRSNSLAQEG